MEDPIEVFGRKIVDLNFARTRLTNNAHARPDMLLKTLFQIGENGGAG